MSKLARLCAIATLLAMQLLAVTSQGFARDLRVPIPERGISTPSQKLNREGVAALKRGMREARIPA